jgi:hypothetical protein
MKKLYISKMDHFDYFSKLLDAWAKAQYPLDNKQIMRAKTELSSKLFEVMTQITTKLHNGGYETSPHKVIDEKIKRNDLDFLKGLGIQSKKS